MKIQSTHEKDKAHNLIMTGQQKDLRKTVFGLGKLRYG